MLTRFDLNFRVQTDLLRLSLLQGSSETALLRREADDCVIVLPASFRFADARHNAWLRRVVAGRLREAAIGRLPARTRMMAEAYGFRYFNRITIKDIRSRWGSCSSLGNINLSLWLMLLPGEFSDYVIKHELAHLDEMNHGPRFWARLDAMTDGRARSLRRGLSAYFTEHYGRYR